MPLVPSGGGAGLLQDVGLAEPPVFRLASEVGELFHPDCCDCIPVAWADGVPAMGDGPDEPPQRGRECSHPVTATPATSRLAQIIAGLPSIRVSLPPKFGDSVRRMLPPDRNVPAASEKTRGTLARGHGTVNRTKRGGRHENG